MELEERLIELQEIFIRKKCFEKKCEEITNDWIYLKERKKELYHLLEQEDVKFKTFESKSIIYLWYDLFISKGKDVSKEMHEYKLVYDLYELINTELVDLKNKIAKSEEYKDEYDRLLKEKEELILENDKEKYANITKLNQEAIKYKSHIRNINDAINAANHLKNSLDYLMDLLKKSKDLDTFDIFGRGLFITVTKTSVFKKTEEKIKNLLYLSNKLIREIKVANYYLDIDLDIRPILDFYDYFIDHLYNDLIDQKRVIHAIDLVKNTHVSLNDITNHLNLFKENTIRDLIEIEKEKRKLLN